VSIRFGLVSLDMVIFPALNQGFQNEERFFENDSLLKC